MKNKLRSLLKYPGGKYSLLEAIETRLPRGDFDFYIEPFVGGASVALNIGRKFPRMVLNDGNGDVISFWYHVAANPDKFLSWVAHFADKRGPDHYQKLRTAFNSNGFDGAQKAALFYYLNREGFNGLIRYNLKGEFNVPYGKYKHFKYPTKDHVLDVSETLNSKACFVSQAWQTFCELHVEPLLAPNKVFLYLDPPYIPISKTSNFTSYCHPFGLEQHEEMRSILDKFTKAGAKWMLSNSKCSETERIFAGYSFHEVEAPRNISCKGNTRGPIREYIITNY